MGKDLLDEGIKGEEEALVTIQQKLYIQGWWAKTNDLSLELVGYEQVNKAQIREEKDLIKFILNNKRKML